MATYGEDVKILTTKALFTETIKSKTGTIAIQIADASAVTLGASGGGVQHKVYGANASTSGGLNVDVGAALGNGVTNSVYVANGSGAGAAIGCFKHSGTSYGWPFLQLDIPGSDIRYYWSRGSGFRVSNDASHIGTDSGSLVGEQTSDERTKDNIRAIHYGLDSILKLKPIEFDQYGEHKLGFGAQTTLPIIPEVVFDTKENRFNDSEKTLLGMSYVQIIPVLTKAIQELAAKVAALEAK